MDVNTPIQWTSQWEIGIPLIDSQHRRLVEMAEDLRQTVILESHNTTGVTKILKGLITYCGDHFECEQMLMQMIGFGPYGGHVAKHRRFTDQTLHWFEEFQNGQLDPKVVLYALLEWLIDHILHQDTQITACCRAKRIDANRFVTVSDVIPKEQPTSIFNVSIEFGLLLFMVPMVGIFLWIAFWQGTDSYIISGLALAVQIGLLLATVFYVRTALQKRTQSLQLHSARQLADNLLAGDIAKRVAVMDLDGIDALVANETSPLVMALKEIVESVKLYLPYIPDTILAVVRGENEEEEEDDQEENNTQLQRTNLVASCVYSSMTGKSRTKSHVSDGVTELSNPRRVSLAKDCVQSIGGDSPRGEDSSDEHRMSTHGSNQNITTSSTTCLQSPVLGFVKSPSSTGSNSNIKYSYLRDSSADQASPVAAQAAAAAAANRLRRASHKSSASAKSAASYGKRSKENTAPMPSMKTRNLTSTWLQKKTVSVLMADVSGFHDLVNHLPVEDVLQMHSVYVSILETVSKGTKGRVNNLLGDRVTLSWNAANAVGNYAQMACRAAIKLRDAYAKDGVVDPRMKFKMAVATGSAWVGNVGSKSNLSFAIIGPVTVIASGLCKLNAFLNPATEILICSNTWRNAKEFFVAKIVAQYDIVCSLSAFDMEIGPTSSTHSTDLHHRSHHPEGSPRTGGEGEPENIPTIQLQTMVTSGSSGMTRMISQMASYAELRKLYAAQLLRPSGRDEGDEWMYVLQNSTNPFEAYNDAMLQLFYGNRTKGLAGLQAYVQNFPGDECAQEVLSLAERQEGVKDPCFKWVFGWRAPV